MSYGNVFELNLVTRVDMLRGEIFCESGGVNGRDEKLDWNYVSASRAMCGLTVRVYGQVSAIKSPKLGRLEKGYWFSLLFP